MCITFATPTSVFIHCTQHLLPMRPPYVPIITHLPTLGYAECQHLFYCCTVLKCWLDYFRFLHSLTFPCPLFSLHKVRVGSYTCEDQWICLLQYSIEFCLLTLAHITSIIVFLQMCVCVFFLMCSFSSSSIFPDRWVRAKGIHIRKSVSTKVRQCTDSHTAIYIVKHIADLFLYHVLFCSTRPDLTTCSSFFPFFSCSSVHQMVRHSRLRVTYASVCNKYGYNDWVPARLNIFHISIFTPRRWHSNT